MEDEDEHFRGWVDDQARAAEAALNELRHRADLLARIGALTADVFAFLLHAFAR